MITAVAQRAQVIPLTLQHLHGCRGASICMMLWRIVRTPPMVSRSWDGPCSVCISIPAEHCTAGR
jgi:hypothetical protein